MKENTVRYFRLLALLAVVCGLTVGATSCPPPHVTCDQSGTPASRQKVVVFAFENRTWSDVGGTQFQSMPYLHGLAQQCSTFANYTEPDTSENSATQYVGQDAGSTANTVKNDCDPSASCESLQDNIFRQVRTARLTGRSFVEGATSNCSTSGNTPHHVGAMYFLAAQDAAACTTEVLPFTKFDPNNLPNFSFITPTRCDSGHDCDNTTADNWAKAHVQPVIDSAAYQAGNVTIFVWYDEQFPTPNMQLGAHAKAGVKSTAVDYGSTLRAWEDMLGVPHIAHATNAVDMRTLANV